MNIFIVASKMIDPDFDPLALLDELAHEMVRLNNRQQKVEQYLQEMSVQNQNIARHLAEQSDELTDLLIRLGKLAK